MARLATRAAQAKDLANSLGVQLPEAEPSEVSLREWTHAFAELAERVRRASDIQAYWEALTKLRQIPSLERLTERQIELSDRLTANSERLWQAWVNLQPARLSREDRQGLSQYASILQMILAADSSRQTVSRTTLTQYYQLFPKISHLLPCWAVTSLSARGRVPFEANTFDLLVVDEASQCDIASALPLLYRARRCVIIGDPKQLRHISAVSADKDQRLQEKHNILDGFAAWSYSTSSLFNLASGLVEHQNIITLRDHHRSHADIIGFSNKHFYEGKLRVATRYDRLSRPYHNGPAVRWSDVRGEVRRPPTGGAVNEREACAVIEHLADLIVHRGYKGSVGVVTPFRAQANRIQELVRRDNDLTEALVQADFIASTAHQFQGDERDAIFFSPTVAAGIILGSISFLKSNGNLFNVAITRARALLHVIGDHNAALNSGVDYLANFAGYVSTLGEHGTLKAERVANDLGPDYPSVDKPELVSEWEGVLYRALYEAGIRPIPQHRVEQYALDFAIIVGDRRLNVEVDGERYHKDWTGELCRRDQIRNQRMIELGWEVKRFWVYKVRDQLDECVAWVANWVENAQASKNVDASGMRTYEAARASDFRT
jgi:very-short-patch-repair endonuclease